MVERKPEMILVVGLGNLLRRDDGVGCRVVERLQQGALPSHVRVVDAGSGGLNLLSLIEGYSQVYIIDAMEAKLAPGTITRRRLSQLRFKSSPGDMDPHHCRIAGVFQLAEALGEYHDPVIYGVQPRDVSHGEALSDPVQEAADRLVGILQDEILTDLDSVSDEGEDCHD